MTEKSTVYGPLPARPLSDALAELAAMPKIASVGDLFTAIEHGDGEHRDWLLEALSAYSEGRPVPAPRGSAKPVPMILTCPSCGERHIDEGEFATKTHHTHACQSCGMCWRPAVVATVGVRFLPGFKNGRSE